MNRVAEKILISSLKLMGDLIVQTPAFFSIRQAFPSAKIVLLCDARYETVLSTNTDIDEIWGAPFADAKRLSGLKKALAKMSFFFRWALKIRRFGFTKILLMDCNDRACLWAFFSGAAVRAGLKQQQFSFLLNRKLADREGSGDYIDFYLKLAFLLGASAASRQTKFPLPANFFVGKLIPGLGKKYLAIHPGASSAGKRWPAENWVKLIEQLCGANPKLQFVLLSGPGEAALCTEIRAAIRKSNTVRRVLLFCERPLTETAAVMRSARMVFCLDSASRHLAAALEVPSISLMTKWILPTWGLYTPAQRQYIVAADMPRESYDVSSITVKKVASLYKRHAAK
jgi:ADP-heptose:LPS heptosyltransferase